MKKVEALNQSITIIYIQVPKYLVHGWKMFVWGFLVLPVFFTVYIPTYTCLALTTLSIWQYIYKFFLPFSSQFVNIDGCWKKKFSPYTILLWRNFSHRTTIRCSQVNMCTFFEKIVKFGYVVQNMLWILCANFKPFLMKTGLLRAIWSFREQSLSCRSDRTMTAP